VPSGGGESVPEEQRELGALLDKLMKVLEERALHAWTRSPESFFDELDDLNLVLELRDRITRG
jgi:hypothetical protein